MNREFNLLEIILVLMFIAAIITLPIAIPTYLGYHLEFSWINGRFIWVK